MAPRKLNVLVYAGTGSTAESVRHCLLTLRRLLYPNYAVIPVTEDALVKEPWQATCALLVIPGGADMGYSRVLNGAGNRRIAQYVRSGGRYLGLCAGGYYGSSRCEFEIGDKDLEVVGRRELGLFRGTCRGCAFKGFAYQSEAGARAVQITIHREEFTAGNESDAAVVIAKALDLPPTAYSYYNGGGVFVDAKSASNVQVLASYADEIDVDGGSKGKGRAAVVYCTVGEGAAILTGPHPEFEAENLSDHPDIPHYSVLLRTLREDDKTQARVKFFKACLVKLGLELGNGNAIQPRLTALHLTSLYPDEVQELMYKWDEIITKSKKGIDSYVKAESDTFRILLPDSGASAWPGAANVKEVAATKPEAADTTQLTGPSADALYSHQHQPFCVGMTMDLTDRAIRYPALANLVDRVATEAAAASVQDTSMLVDILGALADHDDEGDAAAASPAPSSASLTVDEWRAKWKEIRATFDRVIDNIYKAVGQVLLGHPDDRPALDPEMRQEIWSAIVHAWEEQRKVAEKKANGAGGGKEQETEEGRLMQLIDEVAGDDTDDGTVKKIVVYEGGWPARVAALDYGSFYASLGAYRRAIANSNLSSNSLGDADLEWGNQLLYAKVTTSTNTLLEKNPKLLSTLPTGFTVTATRQLAARGRGSNVWLAPEGQLILSTVINHPHRVLANTSSYSSYSSYSSGGYSSSASRPVVFVQYLAAIAIVDAIGAYAPGFEELDVKLKWPNDIYARAKASGSGKGEYVKIGGILSYCTFQNNQYQVVLGIGLNAVNKRPTISLQQLLPPAVAEQHPIKVEKLLACLLVHLEALYKQFMRQGFAGELERRYYKHWLHTDQMVTLEAVEGAPRARVLGISNDWGLLQVAEVVESSDGREDRLTGRVWKLQSDENSFDYWKGLVRTKT
ncbi:biotin apo-protein [Ophiostoma piceae UAMH 11346]|uniref:Biotin apo-protein n=1 Tax=Ophiostoma piceae (strain UAMH 11346) TaxID=1262450 RepID=S3D1U8_OPHP1|nr:biotin apo-protein [Ophiostoma piceae UAMH 11346]